MHCLRSTALALLLFSSLLLLCSAALLLCSSIELHNSWAAAQLLTQQTKRGEERLF